MISGPLVLLEGYYGAGNFGDDLLLLAAYRLLRRWLPTTAIAVSAKDCTYIPRLLGELPFLTAPGDVPPTIKCVIQGGGGLYFDFNGGSHLASCVQYLIRRGHTPFISGLRSAASRVKHLRSAVDPVPFKAAIGIGVGPFALGSWREVSVAIRLDEFGLVITRDSTSQATCRAWGLRGQVYRGTDLAFLRNDWNGQFWRRSRRGSGRRPRVAFILRRWRYGSGTIDYLTSVADVLSRLAVNGIDAQVVLFQPDGDAEAIMRHIGGGEMLAWDPSCGSVEDFLDQLGQFDLIVSARAHGAIAAGLLGVPSICIWLEPKMDAVLEMLGPATALWRPPYHVDTVVEEILSRIGRGPDLRPRERIAVDESVKRAELMAENIATWLAEAMDCKMRCATERVSTSD